MATLWVTEYREIASYGQGSVPVAAEPATAEQAVTVGNLSAAFGPSTRYVRLVADADCHVKFGAGSPSAGTSNQKLISGVPEWRGVVPGQKVDTAAVS